MKFLRGLAAASYPLLIFAGLHWLTPRWLALLIVGSVLLRVALRWHRPSPEELRRALAPALALAAVLVPTLLLDDARTLLFVPALVNAALLVAFGRTLQRGPSQVETFARLQHPDLSPAQVRHCRSVTLVWCGFFVVNGAIALALALSGDLWAWTLYTGAIAYAGMGLLLAGEFVVRAWRFRNYQGTLFEPLFDRLFPRRPTA